MLIKMKNIYLIFLTLIVPIYGSCQTTISLEQYATYRCEDCEPPEDLIYVKDLNNTLEKYTGKWIGNDGVTQVIYDIRKYLNVDNDGFKHDGLIVRYELRDLNTNQITLSTIGLPDNNINVIKGAYFINDIYYANYMGFDYCGQYGYLLLSYSYNLITGNQFTIRTLLNGDIYFPSECPNGRMPSPIPSDVPLTKL